MKNLLKVVRFDYNRHLPQSATDKTSDLFYILSTLYLAEKTEKNNIYLTPKGLRVMSELTGEVSENKQLIGALLVLEKTAQDLLEHPSKGVDITHSLKVVDTTDNKKVKTIEELIEEISPEQRFKEASQFKYIEPQTAEKVKKAFNFIKYYPLRRRDPALMLFNWS